MTKNNNNDGPSDFAVFKRNPVFVSIPTLSVFGLIFYLVVAYLPAIAGNYLGNTSGTLIQASDKIASLHIATQTPLGIVLSVFLGVVIAALPTLGTAQVLINRKKRIDNERLAKS